MIDGFLLELKDVEKTYHHPSGEEVQALKNISLNIKKGSFTVITGPSGSGKSTFIKMAGLIREPSQGSVIFKDKETKNLSTDERAVLVKENVGFILQHSNLLPYLTVLENLMLPMSKSDRNHALKLLDRLGIEDPNMFPEKLTSLEKQKVALARAVINNPSLILADEPTGRLQGGDKSKFLEILLSFKDNFTLIIATNNLMLTDYAQGVFYLHDGILEKK